MFFSFYNFEFDSHKSLYRNTCMNLIHYISKEIGEMTIIMRRIPISHPFSNRSRQTTPYKISLRQIRTLPVESSARVNHGKVMMP